MQLGHDPEHDPLFSWVAPSGSHEPPPQRYEKPIAVFARAPIPPAVELGFHLCYGDMDGKHGIEPLDLGKAVELANLLCAQAGRTVHWMHMPVPISRDDDAYFAPLANLKMHPQTELYLGLVHAGDGAEGTLRRMRTAARHVRTRATSCTRGAPPVARARSKFQSPPNKTELPNATACMTAVSSSKSTPSRLACGGT